MLDNKVLKVVRALKAKNKILSCKVLMRIPMMKNINLQTTVESLHE
jgi:hypothetical protein